MFLVKGGLPLPGLGMADPLSELDYAFIEPRSDGFARESLRLGLPQCEG